MLFSHAESVRKISGPMKKVARQGRTDSLGSLLKGEVLLWGQLSPGPCDLRHGTASLELSP